MTKAASIFATAIASIALASCSGTENPEPEPVVYNIVTYESTSADGSVSTFSYQVNGDSPLITLTAKWNVPEAIIPGMRLLLAYVPESLTTQSGAVKLLGFTTVPGGEAKISSTIPKSEPMRLNSIWRSGNYLNLNGIVTLSGQVSEISLYADQSTINSPEPHTYVVIGNGDGNLDKEAERKLYASWDISQIWAMPALEALLVTYIDSENKPQTIKLIK